MSTVAPSDAGGRLTRFASGFGRVSSVLGALGLLAAVAMTVPGSWFGLGDDADGPSYVEMRPAEPVRMSVAGLGLVTPLVGSDLDPRQALAEPPADAPLVSWWRGSAKPGAARGQTILTAHATTTGGALSGITGLERGAVVDLLTRQGTMRYEVASVRTFDAAQLAKSALTLFKQDGGAGRLVMVSSEAWNGATYQRSVVVTATPLGRPTESG